MKQFLIVLGLIVPIMMFTPIQAQEAADSTSSNTEERVTNLEGNLEGFNEAFAEVKSIVDALKKIKVSGYIQAQYQTAESDGISNFSGGSFEKEMHSRMMIKRGRIKFNYKDEYTQYVLQFDVTEKGFATKDVYMIAKEPWFQTGSVQAGIFNRPFGYEIAYSSSMRESPERSRLFQSLFPGERDLGLALNLKSEEGFFSTFNLKAGIFNGNGLSKETDNSKDFIGRVGLELPFYETNMSVDLGISGYLGKVRVPTGKSLYELNSEVSAVKVDNQLYTDRSYIGADFQFYYDSPFLGGLSLRGEYIQGKQPGTNKSNISFTSAPSDDIYLRNFNGYYLLFLQNIGQWNQLVVKYDSYDPNSDVATDAIGLNNDSKLGAGDLKYSTLGIGWIYHLDGNIKFTLYYESVQNETSINLAGFNEDLKDDVLTFRMQYKF